MTDTPSSAHSGAQAPPGIDTTVAHAARVYDYLLGGTENFPIDREVAERQAVAYGGGLAAVRAEIQANRAFLGRGVRYLVNDAGIRQLLDIGTGLPSSNHVHEVAQREKPDCRIVYVDNDPLVLTHARTLLKSTPEGAASFIIGDARDPENLVMRAAATLDLTEPTAVILSAVLHLIPDDQDPYGIVSRLLDAVPSGSYLMISHMASDLKADDMANLTREHDKVKTSTNYMFAPRSRDQVLRFVDGLDIVEPGLVSVDAWRPDGPADPPSGVYGVVARKP